MACEVEQTFGSMNFIENATKLHLRALESWKRGLHTLNERLMSMQIERDTLREQLEAMHAGYKKQLQLKVMKINELQSTISDITKKLNSNNSEHVKEEDADSNDIEHSTSLHEEGFDDPYTSGDDQSPDLSHTEYGDVYLDAGTDDDTPSLCKQRGSKRTEGSRCMEPSYNMDQPPLPPDHRNKSLEESKSCNDVSSTQLPHSQEDKATERLEPDADTEAAASGAEHVLSVEMSDESVVVTVLPEDNGRSDYLQTEEISDHLAQETDGNSLSCKSSDDHSALNEAEEAGITITLAHQDNGSIEKEEHHAVSRGSESKNSGQSHKSISVDKFNRDGGIIVRDGIRGTSRSLVGHGSIKRSVSESDVIPDQSFKLPKFEPTTYRPSLPIKGHVRKHLLPHSMSHGYGAIPRRSNTYDSSFVPTMSNVSYHGGGPESGISTYTGRSPQFGALVPHSGAPSSGSNSGTNTGSISQLASFYQKEFDISKQYKCDFCGSKYTKLASLRRHLRAHTGIKPYKCMSCFKEFTRRDVLKIHMERHKVQNQYGCYICGLKFAYVKDLREHGLNQHKEYMSVFKDNLVEEKKVDTMTVRTYSD